MKILDYFFSNIPLFCVSFVVVFLAIRNFAIRKNESIYFIIFTTIVLFLSIAVTMERYEASLGNKEIATFFTTSGYIVRPVLLYFFCLLSNMEQRRSKHFYLLWAIPLVLNFIIYLFPLFFKSDILSKLVFYYEPQLNGTVKFMRGGFLNFFSHVISFVYIILLIFISTVRFNGKHRRDALIIILCIGFIITTVVVEVITGRNDLLNIVCEICALSNYIFITAVNSSRDALTNLYDRRTFNEDVRRYKKSINGIIQIDMNRLKYYNDNFGHDVGDLGLITIAGILDSSLHKGTMIAYRLSGDEFIILMIHGKKEYLDNTISTIKEKLEKTEYSIAVGECFIDKNSGMEFDEAIKIAEDLMYYDKDQFYLNKQYTRR